MKFADELFKLLESKKKIVELYGKKSIIDKTMDEIITLSLNYLHIKACEEVAPVMEKYSKMEKRKSSIVRLINKKDS